MPPRPQPPDEATRAFARYRASGSPADLAAVFDATALGLSVLAGHLARRSGDAEDLVQQTFLVAMRDAKTFDGERPVAAWLAGILRHRALELNRRRERSRGAGDAPLDDLVAREPSPLDVAADAETAERIAAAIARIDGPSQQVLALRLVHGLEPTAIAHALGRPPGTVRMQLARGLERLRELLPASLAAVLATLALETRGLAAVRTAVLEAALAAAPAAAVATTTATPLVALLVMKKWILAAALVIAAVVAVLSITSNDTPRLDGAAHSDSVVRTTTDELAPTDTRPLVAPFSDNARTSVSAEPLVNPVASTASLTVAVVSPDDGTPRPGIGVVVATVGSGVVQRLVTDAAGEARFTEGIANGTYQVGLDRQRQTHHVEVDGATDFVYELAEGVDVVGRVVDFHGAPVADASVCFVDDWRPATLFEITRTDAEGRFAAEAVQQYERLVARSPGQQISAHAWIGDGTSEIVLTLGARGHEVRGRVVDANGAPVPHARLVIGSEQRARRAWEGASAPAEAPSDSPSILLEGTVAMADALGRYTLSEVPAGNVLVIARTPDRSSELVGWSQGFLPFGGALELDVTLGAGARITGTVTDEQGRPVANCPVETHLLRSLELGTFFGDAVFGSTLDNWGVSTDANGVFTAVGLLPGVHSVDVGTTSFAGASLERKELRVRIGETVRLDVSVELGLDPSIRLVGHDGEPLEAWQIEVENAQELGLGWFVFVQTDAEGRATIRGLDVGARLALRILPPGSGWTAKRCEIEASPVESVIEIGAHELPSATVVARLTSVPPGLELELIAASGRGTIGNPPAVPDATGAVRFDGVVPGEYVVLTAGTGHPRGDELARFVVALNTVHDAGLLELPERGRLVIELECDDGAPASVAQVARSGTFGHEVLEFEQLDSGFTSPPLIPGSYTLRIVPTDAAPFDVELEVDTRPLQIHRLTCTRGARVRVEIAPYRSGTTTPQAAEFVVSGSESGHLFSRTFERAADAATFDFDVHLAPGTYHCWVHEPNGPARPPFDTEFVVPADGVELRVVLD